MTASEASIIDRPVKVRPYWMVDPTRAIQKRSLRQPLGMGTNHSRSRAATKKRMLIRNNGGNSTKAALDSVNPRPQVSGTQMASNRSRGLKGNSVD